MKTKHITVGSRDEHDKIVSSFRSQRFNVELETERETHLVRPLVLPIDVLAVIVGTLLCVLPGLVYYVAMLFRPRRVVVTIGS